MKQREEVTLEEMLIAREARVLRQRELLRLYPGTLVCFTLNIPGPCKSFPLALQSFQEGKRLIKNRLDENSLIFFDEEIKKTGCTGFFITKEDPLKIKRLMVEIEEYSDLGRLFDIDVMQGEGTKISREELNLSERKCLICENPAFICGRNRTHSSEELSQRVEQIIESYFNRQAADRIAEAAAKALLYEVSVTPKPGLVDRNNNGAHKDMDFFTFLDSTAALTAYFRDAALKGLGFEGEPKELFEALRYPGILAEEGMFKATGGINTHKGLVFSLGLVCGAAGRLHKLEALTGYGGLLDYCALMTESIFTDFENITEETAKTAGERLYASYGMTGIRGEAALGFLNVRKYSLPVLKALTAKGHSLNDAGVAAFMHLLANVCDTNIIHRSDINTLKEIQAAAENFLEKEPSVKEILEEAKRLDREFTKGRISPGGSADLLAITYMLYFLFPATQ